MKKGSSMAATNKTNKGQVKEDGKLKKDKKYIIQGLNGGPREDEAPQKITKGKSGKTESIELKLGTTELPLEDAQLVLDQYKKLKTDDRFVNTSGFLTELFRKLQPLEKGQSTRLEVDMTVRQFQDYSEGFKYKMDAKPRGYALIISNGTFYQIPGDPLSRELPKRPGADTDAENLETVLTGLGFRVVRKDNLKKWEMEHEIKTIARADHKAFDCFLLILSSHGNLGKLYGSDGQQVMMSQQLKLFKTEACKDLKGKPKLCFFQACPVGEEDVLVVADTAALAMEGTNKGKKNISDEKPKFLINDVDFLVGYSSLPGSVSYRSEQSSSFYLNSLYKNLKDKGEAYDLVTILEDVNRELTAKKAKYRAGDVNAVSTFVSCLRGPIFFQ
ncbi:caspase-3-like isoform X1 [Mytilus californianus]|uniref:caspase-3-like isoform X1 n=1 Tax=Mytilus californianus TaxID=6549 RepID=UPI002246C737|nr:caspase-3-like isoform X1 [Mytilus californianus]